LASEWGGSHRKKRIGSRPVGNNLQVIRDLVVPWAYDL
jgi:hypothetical protein